MEDICDGSHRRFPITLKEYEQHKRGMKRECPVCKKRIPVLIVRPKEGGEWSVEIRKHDIKE